ncbi:mitochondrial ornithine carrier protein [Scheffersomyces xylosifermentans]|uniref:mitochondrial ornithine carrier protein n=1 Tax=Scheffersomyces xylosifermentans TaxID=1304137 RepID=UPI00315DFFB0
METPNANQYIAFSDEAITHHEHLETNPLKEITCGAVSGMLGKLVEFPFDTIKVRLQSAPEATPLRTVQMIRFTYYNEGIINGFYKGLKAPLIGACVETAVLFTSYNYSSNFFLNQLNKSASQGHKFTTESLPFWTKCVSGGFAGFMASFILTPIELIKCQLQVSNLVTKTNQKSVSYFSLIKHIVKQERGVLGLWNGLSSTLLREMVGTSIWFSTYEFINDQFKKHKPPIHEDLQLLISGAMAGITFNFSVFPVDTIKSNIQTYDILNSGSTTKYPSTKKKGSAGFTEITKMLLARPGGIKNLYSGLSITLIRCIPANALIFYSYEILKRNF